MKRFAFFLIVLVLAALPLAAVFGQGSPDTLVRSTLTGDVSTLNWALVSDSASIDVSAFLWAGLFETDPMTAAPTPGLTTWEVSEDGLTYTFTIRDDAVWSDGTPITSNDVKFTYDAIMSDKVQSPRKGRVAAIESLTVVDDKTFRIVLPTVDCTIWGGAFSALRPMPAHKFAADFSDFMTTEFNQAPDVTSGPYIVAERQPDEFIRVVANPKFYRGEPKIPNILFKVLVDTAVINQALLAGEIDYAFMYPDQLEQLGDTGGRLNAYVFPLNNTPLLHLNWADPDNPQPAFDESGNRVEQTPNKFFGDVRVRRAIMMGIDREAIMGTLGEGGGYMQVGPITPPFAWAYNPDVVPWPYDPAAAAALLDEAGWTDQDGNGVRECHGCLYAEEGTPFSFKIEYTPLVDLYDNITLVTQDQLGQIGLEVEVVSMEWGAFLNDVLLPQKFNASVVGFGGGSEVDGIAYNIMHSKNDVPGSGFNADSYVNPEVDKLLDEGRSMVGCKLEDRAPIYYEIQRIAREDVAYGFTVGTNQVHVMNARLLNYDPGPWNTYNHIELWELAK